MQVTVNPLSLNLNYHENFQEKLLKLHLMFIHLIMFIQINKLQEQSNWLLKFQYCTFNGNLIDVEDKQIAFNNPHNPHRKLISNQIISIIIVEIFDITSHQTVDNVIKSV